MYVYAVKKSSKQQPGFWISQIILYQRCAHYYLTTLEFLYSKCVNNAAVDVRLWSGHI